MGRGSLSAVRAKGLGRIEFEFKCRSAMSRRHSACDRDARDLSVASELSCNHFGFGFGAEKISVDRQVRPLECGQFDLVVLDPGGQGLTTNKHDAHPVRKRVNCVDNSGEIGWSKPVVIAVTYKLGQARTLIDAPGRMMLAARLRASTESCLSSQYFFHSA